MAATRICKACGREYEYCRTNRRVAGMFRYQDVACSPECGAIYLSKVLESRKEKQAEIVEIKDNAETEAVSEEVIEEPVVTKSAKRNKTVTEQ